MAFTTSDPDVRLPRFSRPVNHTSHDGKLHRGGPGKEGRFQALDEVNEVKSLLDVEPGSVDVVTQVEIQAIAVLP